MLVLGIDGRVFNGRVFNGRVFDGRVISVSFKALPVSASEGCYDRYQVRADETLTSRH